MVPDSAIEERLKYLYERYTQKSCTYEELQEWFEYIKKPELRAIIENLADTTLFNSNKESPEANEIDWDYMFNNITGDRLDEQDNKSSKSKVLLIWRVAAAAVIILLLGTISYLAFTPTKETTALPTAQVIQNDVAPGQEGAILTLSNGTSIVLDNVDNGLLAQEGGMQIVKSDGQISYKGEVNDVLEYNTMSTPKGRLYSLQLADGTTVWLNAASSITFPVAFSGNERRVLVTGEVYFEVAHDATKPFIVQKDDVAVEVLGTVFNINAYDDEDDIDITLLEGSVKVSQSATSTTKMLAPEQQAQINNRGQIRLNNNVDIQATVAWKNGFFDFKSSDIENLMRQAARWYDIEVEYKREKPTDRFTGKISRNVNLSEFLKVLEYSEVNAKIEGRKIIIMP